MAGEPAETLIGVGFMGFGAILVFAAFKNVSPIELIRTVVTTGSLDTHNPKTLGKVLATGGSKAGAAGGSAASGLGAGVVGGAGGAIA